MDGRIPSRVLTQYIPDTLPTKRTTLKTIPLLYSVQSIFRALTKLMRYHYQQMHNSILK